MPSIDLKDQYFGCEIEMTGLTRQQAAEAVASLFGTNAVHSRSSRTYDPWEVTDNEGKTWRFVYDSSIHGSHRTGRQQVPIGDGDYKVEMNSPKLEYSEMGKLQEVVRTLRHAGAVVNGSCGMHVHVDASKHTPQSLKNALSIMYSKEDILFKALNVNESRVERWCQKVREPMLEKIRKLPSNTTMDRLRREWYEGSDGSYEHYNWTRYYALNLHSVFYRGTLEWRCFESTLHAGKVRANITLALAISAQAINQSRTVMRKTEISENPAFTFRTFLLRLGLIGPEYKNVREHLLSKLPGDRAFYHRPHDLSDINGQNLRHPAPERQTEFRVEQVVVLADEEYRQFQETRFLQDQIFLFDYQDKMWFDPGSLCWHCVLVKGENSRDGILVESEGYCYTRYAAFAPDCGKLRLQDIPVHYEYPAKAPEQKKSRKRKVPER